MSQRVDRKLEEIPVARFAYRHEAEFAAGFLEDAGIPYRLQIDDPVLGVPMSASATLWVAAVDEREARDLLELDGGNRGAISSSASRAIGRRRRPRKGTDRSGEVMNRKDASDLTLRQRGVAMVGGAVVLGALAAGPIREAEAVVHVVIAVTAAGLFLIALVGRAPGAVKRILSALSGDAP